MLHVGDRIIVQSCNAGQGEWFEGRVHIVRKDDVGLCFDSAFSARFRPDEIFHVRFKLNRRVLRRQHQALDLAVPELDLDRLLFPEWNHVSRASRVGSIEAVARCLYNPTIKDNRAQMHAVATIADQPPGAVPFIIFGP